MKGFSRALVTGGAGFIGSHLVDALLGRGFCVRIVDNLSGGSLENIKCWFGDSRFEFVEGDLKDPEIAFKSVDGVDLVFIKSLMFIPLRMLRLGILERENCSYTFSFHKFDCGKIETRFGFI